MQPLPQAMSKTFLAVAALAILSIAASAGACPSCATGTEARALVWRDDFFYFAAVIALKFLVILAICWRVEALGKPDVRARSGVT